MGYHGKAGAVLGYVLHFDGPDGVNKDVLPLTWSGAAARPREWRWKSRDVPRLLYGLDRLAARHEVPVIVAGARRSPTRPVRSCPVGGGDLAGSVQSRGEGGLETSQAPDWSYRDATS